jgi:beta-galactosidase/beta-glucuronidase
MPVPRPEYPRPQFVREDWRCLNGEWEFEIDHADSGLERGLLERALVDRIRVPFCPESKLSGIDHTDFMSAVWYRRRVTAPEAWAGCRVLLHFQAVDYDATVWADGVEVGRHRGGFTPFTCDLGEAAGRTITIVLRARDDHRRAKPLGKQSQRPLNHGCHYTRTTGIWQTVWLEPVPVRAQFGRPHIVPDVAAGRFLLSQPILGDRAGLTLRATLLADDEPVCTAEQPADAVLRPLIELAVPDKARRLWEPGDPFLYDLDVELIDHDGSLVDRARSYTGLRSVTLDGHAIRINGRVIFQRLVLDQGYYPDGVMTAPSDAALRQDIELARSAGFNGARLHQKVFEERFLYHADRLGYLVWGEFADWGIDHAEPGATALGQWAEVLERDRSHPAIIGWCPLNETRQPIGDRITDLNDLTLGLFRITRAADPTRPVIDSSGYSHRVAEADVFDCHNYIQEPDAFRESLSHLVDGQEFISGPKNTPWSIRWKGQPYFVSEFGGIWWNPEAGGEEDSWGYGDRPKTINEFYNRFQALCDSLLDHPRVCAYCYTQLTDVFQEQNGIFHFDRRPKFDLERLRAVQTRPAAAERAAVST